MDITKWNIYRLDEIRPSYTVHAGTRQGAQRMAALLGPGLWRVEIAWNLLPPERVKIALAAIQRPSRPLPATGVTPWTS
jgi:hypothetical protein